MIRAALVFAAGVSVLAAQTPAPAPIRGLSGAAALARTYDTILDADFDSAETRRAETCPPAAPEFCDVLDAVAVSWEIALDPDDRRHDHRFSTAAEAAITSTEAWTEREPQRAEAWFALGAAYGTRAQWRVLRKEPVAAARDGKRIKEVLERALALDPTLHDAKLGLGMYRYYADVAPTALRMMRWLLVMPGGDRAAGLRQMIEARDRGQVLPGEADFQLHLIYLWYEGRFVEGLAIVRDLQARYPHNPLFYETEAAILDVYFHDRAASAAVLKKLIALADARRVNAPAIAAVRARTLLNAIQARDKR